MPDAPLRRAASQAEVAFAQVWPQAIEPLIGRQDDLRELDALIASHEVRLITITATGGVGKTSLVLASAARWGASRDDAPVIVALDQIRVAEMVAPAVAKALGLTSTDADVERQLIARLESQPHLLVLDNFEQVTPAAPLLTRLLAACPQLKIMVTSRHAPLGIAGEHVYPLRPLALPDATSDLDVDGLRQVPAVACLLRHAPPLDLDRDTRNVVSLCRLLDGIPLALELAARRAHVISLAELADEARARLPLLTLGRIDAPARHQTLSATIDWSYDLLTERQRRAFRRLAVFKGSFSREAANTVAGASLDLLTGLVDRRLVESFTTPNGSRRFRMLQPLFEYAQMTLESDPDELADVRAAHLRWALTVIAPLAADRFRSLLYDERGHRFEQLLDLERSNLLEALDWAIGRRDVDAALDLTGSLSDYWYRGGGVFEGLTAIGKALDLAATAEPPPSDRSVKALAGACLLHHAAGNLAEAGRLGAEALAAARSLGNSHAIAEASNNLAMVEIDNGQFDRAGVLLGETLERFSESCASDIAWRSAVLSNLACLALLTGDLDRAQHAVEESLELTLTVNDSWGYASHFWMMGDIACAGGAIREALDHFDEAFTHWLSERATTPLSAWTAVVQGLASCAVILAHEARDQHGGQLEDVLTRLAAACRMTGLAKPLDRPQFWRLFPEFDARSMRPGQAKTAVVSLNEATAQVESLLRMLRGQLDGEAAQLWLVTDKADLLTEKQRHTLERLISGSTVKEIALADQVRVSTVYERLDRAKAALGLREHATLPEVAAVAVRHHVA